jgi:hypothetical protein
LSAGHLRKITGIFVRDFLRDNGAFHVRSGTLMYIPYNPRWALTHDLDDDTALAIKASPAGSDSDPRISKILFTPACREEPTVHEIMLTDQDSAQNSPSNYNLFIPNLYQAPTQALPRYHGLLHLSPNATPQTIPSTSWSLQVLPLMRPPLLSSTQSND